MGKRKVGFYFSCLVLLSALLRWPTYTFPFRTLSADNFWSLEILMGNALSLSFLIFPVLAFLGFVRHWRSSYIWLGLSPVIFFLFGSVPIPFAGYFYSENHALFITVVNIAALLIVVWLYRSERARYKNSLKRDAAKPQPLAL